MLAKQKIKKLEFSSMDNLGCGGRECSGKKDGFDWLEGLTHWSNCNDLMGVLNEDKENGGGLLGGVKGMEWQSLAN